MKTKVCGFESHCPYKMITFKYKNKQYTTNNLEKKLSKLGITKDEIEVMGIKKEEPIDTSITKYYFRNRKNKSILVSIYPTLDNLSNYINIKDYESFIPN